MIDSRREARQIARQFNRFHNTIGEGMLWFMFDAKNSAYDRVYDEGYRKYEPARKVPLLWVDQQEAPADYSPEGRRPTQRLRCAVSAMALWEAGIDVTETHGNALNDTSPSTVWRKDRVNDIIYYGEHFYAISGFQIKGRVKDQDVIIGITGIEMFPGDEFNLDIAPADWFPPVTPAQGEPEPIEDDRVHAFFGDIPPDDPDVGDLWFNPTEDTTGYALDNPVPFGVTAPENPAVGSLWLDTEDQ